MAVKDTRGQDWLIAVCVSNLMRVKEQAKIDLLTILTDQNVLTSVYSDMTVQLDVLFWLCQTQVTAQNLTREQFNDVWNGDTLQAAMDDMLEGLARFFPKQKGEALRKGVQALKELLDKMLTAQVALVSSTNVDAIVQKASEEVKKLTDEAISNIGKKPDDPTKSAGNSSGTAPESSASTPAPSPAAS